MTLIRTSILLLAFSLAPACSDRAGSPGADAPVPDVDTDAGTDAGAPTQAQLDAFLAQGAEPALRRLRPLDYVLHHALMQATGMEQQLGGQARSISALGALAQAYDRQLRGPAGQLPQMVPASFTGEGMDSGLLGVSLVALPMMMTGVAASTQLAQMDATALDAAIAAGTAPLAGAASSGGGAVQVTFTATDVTTTVEMSASAGDLKGTTRSKVRMDMCPDASGTITLDVEVESRMSLASKAGTGGTVKASMHMVRHVDDDARLIDAPDASRRSSDFSISGQDGDGRSRLIDVTLDPLAGDRVTQQAGLTIFDSGRADDVLRLAQSTDSTLAAMVNLILRGINGQVGTPTWESGHCVTLQPTSAPSRRKGVRPSTAFQVMAAPRAKGDGAPAGGTVRATLQGGSHLDRNGDKVPADAQYAYTAPAQKDQQASIAFEARSKRGVGRATLEFDTREKHAYRITVFPGCSGVSGKDVCDLEKPFSIEGRGCAGGAISRMDFNPSKGTGGKMEWSTRIGSISADFNGTYTVEEADDAGYLHTTLTGCAMGPGAKSCGGTGPSITMTRIDPCEG